MVAVTIPTIAVIWAIAVPGVLTTSSVFALLGLIVAAGWVGRSACGNGLPIASLAQLLHETDSSGARQRRRDRR